MKLYVVNVAAFLSGIGAALPLDVKGKLSPPHSHCIIRKRVDIVHQSPLSLLDLPSTPINFTATSPNLLIWKVSASHPYKVKITNII